MLKELSWTCNHYEGDNKEFIATVIQLNFGVQEQTLNMNYSIATDEFKGFILYFECNFERFKISAHDNLITAQESANLHLGKLTAMFY